MKLISFKIRESIQKRIFVYSLLLMLIPTALLGISSYYISINILEEKVSTSFVAALQYISNSIEREFQQLERIITFASINNDVIKLMTKEYNTYQLDYYLDYKLVNQDFKDYFTYSNISSYIYMLAIYGQNEKLYTISQRDSYVNKKSLFEYFNKEVKIGGSKLNWLGINKKSNFYHSISEEGYVVSMLSNIKNSISGERVAKIYIGLDTRLFEELFKKNLNSSSTFFIVNNNGRYAYHPDNNKINNTFKEFNRIRDKGDSGYLITDRNESKNLLAYYYMKDYDWWVIRTTPFANLIRENRMLIFNVFLTVFVIGFLLTGIILFFVSSRIVEPIKNLIRTMKLVRKGDLTVRNSYQSDDEIGELSTNFNYMIERVNSLFEVVLEEQTKIKDAEYKALQAQINPHFLYNTLSSIRWMAIIQKADNIREVTEVLTRLIRSTTNKTGHFITIAEELAMLKDYIYIEDIRYKGKFDVHFNIDNTVLNYHCIKFILQPLVENAIFHGIEPKEGVGDIWIKIERQESSILFTVKDDGIGMTKREIEILWNEAENKVSGFSGIGIVNVDQRIKLTYGREYGITIQSEIEKYTVVKIKIPVNDSYINNDIGGKADDKNNDNR